jgi:hypothetical protein
MCPVVSLRHTPPSADHVLVLANAVDATPEQVGELAAAHGIVPHALTGMGGLEKAFFHLIHQPGPAGALASAEEALS